MKFIVRYLTNSFGISEFNKNIEISSFINVDVGSRYMSFQDAQKFLSTLQCRYPDDRLIIEPVNL
jgi:hypothetical protein